MKPLTKLTMIIYLTTMKSVVFVPRKVV